MKESDDLLTNYCVIMTHSHSDVESSTLVKYGKVFKIKHLQNYQWRDVKLQENFLMLPG